MRKNGKPGASLVESCAKLKDWRADVRANAAAHTHENPTPLACRLELIFHMPRPKSHYRTGKFSEMLKPNAPTLHTKKPDLDKLTRGVKDALSGVLYLDDSQVCSLAGEKIYSDTPGVAITLKSLHETEAA